MFGRKKPESLSKLGLRLKKELLESKLKELEDNLK